MTIVKNKVDTDLTLKVEGRLDTTTAPELEAVVKAELDGIKNLTMDLVSLEYISSAGLRVLLAAQKIMSKQGAMVVKNANDDVKEIFEVTGFTDILTIE